MMLAGGHKQSADSGANYASARRYPTQKIGHLMHHHQHHGEATNVAPTRQQQERSINTSSASSSGYTSNNNNNNMNHHFYSQQAGGELYLASDGRSMMRAPMVPMMIDDDDDDDGDDLADNECRLIDDLDELELSNSVEDNNNISELYGHHYRRRPPPAAQCVDSAQLGAYLSSSVAPKPASLYARPALGEEEDVEDADEASRSFRQLAHYQLSKQASKPQLNHSYTNYNQQQHQQRPHYTQTGFSYIQQQPPSLSEFQSRELALLLAYQQQQQQQQYHKTSLNRLNNKQQQHQEARLVQARAELGTRRPATTTTAARSSEDKRKMQSGSRQQLTGGANHDQPAYQQQQRRGTSNNNGASGRSSRRPGGSRSTTPSGGATTAGGNPAEKPALGWCGNFAKLLLFIANLLFWTAGIALGAWGILSLVDDHKYNLSQLLVFEPSSRMSLFQLLSWSFITLGCATILVGVCGCSAILKNNRWILGLYIFLILAIFALDLATGLLAIIFQERLVANVRLRLANKLRSDYGVHASFTAAIDYIQTRFECCGLEGHFDYDQSLWRLQRLGGFDATVARTCCHLRNTFDDQAHINPRPVNESMCQSTDVRFHQSYRYRKGCMDELEKLIRQKIWTFTVGCGAVGAVILLSLFFATCFCRSIPTMSSRKSSSSSPTADSNHHDSKKKSTKNHHHHHQRHYG